MLANSRFRRFRRRFARFLTGLLPAWHKPCIPSIAAAFIGAALYGNGRIEMIGWAVTFLIIALIAGVLGFSGVAGTAANIAWILFVVGLILAIVMFIGGRRRPPI